MIGYHKTDDNTRFLIGYLKGGIMKMITIPFVAPMDEIFRDMSADGLYEYFKPRIMAWIRKR